jgi:hypothetical protein
MNRPVAGRTAHRGTFHVRDHGTPGIRAFTDNEFGGSGSGDAGTPTPTTSGSPNSKWTTSGGTVGTRRPHTPIVI